jgi:hypothetical protein
LCMPKAHTIIPSKIFPIIFSISSVTWRSRWPGLLFKGNFRNLENSR